MFLNHAEFFSRTRIVFSFSPNAEPGPSLSVMKQYLLLSFLGLHGAAETNLDRPTPSSAPIARAHYVI